MLNLINYFFYLMVLGCCFVCVCYGYVSRVSLNLVYKAVPVTSELRGFTHVQKKLFVRWRRV